MNSIVDVSENKDDSSSGQKMPVQSTSFRVENRSEVESLLKKLNKNHTLLSIRLGDNNKTFGSMLLEINLEQDYLVLDEIYPRHEIKKSLLNCKLAIDAQLDGIELEFRAQIQAIAEQEGVEYYKVSFPKSLFFYQRRASFRVGVGISTAIPVALSTIDDVLLHAELRDISLGGISARINTPVAGNFEVGQEIPTCVIQTSDNKKIVCSLEIARIEAQDNAQSIRIGARFIRLSSSDRHELSRFIAKLERENIKKLKRTAELN